MISLPSGKELVVNPAPFAQSKDLLQAILAEMHMIHIGKTQNGMEFMKEVLCRGFASASIEKALWACFPRCLYDGRKIDKDSFEKSDCRGDYVQVCIEVAKENVLPFMNGLYAQLAQE